ncbi:MAG: S-layer homology domain-containing protein [Hungatella hathewayi]|nr:S-layer homology domain-containing protein [Hungatella hathewayi]
MGINKATPHDADYVCDHRDGCGYTEKVEGVPCTHSCELCESTPLETPPAEKPSAGNPPEKNEMAKDTCICDIKCTPADSKTGTAAVINPDCPFCSAEHADLSLCVGAEEERDTAYDRVVALFKALPTAGSITEKTTEERKDKLTAQITAAMDALEALSDDDYAKFTREHDDLLIAAAALQAAIAGTVPRTLAGGPMPTAEIIGSYYYVFANGTSLILAAGSSDTGKTVIYIDQNDDGEIDSGDTIFTPNVGGATDSTEAGNDIDGWYIFGGCLDDNVEGNIQLTMLGGKVKTIYGGGYASGGDAAVSGSTSIKILGGKVGSLYGGGKGNNHISSTGPTVVYIGSDTTANSVYGGGEGAVVKGDAIVTVEGTVINEVGGGDGDKGTVEGSAFVTIESGAVVEKNNGGKAIVKGGGNNTVDGKTIVTIAGTVVGDVYGGGDGLVAQGTSVVLQSGAKVSGKEIGVYGGGTNSEGVVTGGTSVIIKTGAMVNNTGGMYSGVYGGGRGDVEGGTFIVVEQGAVVHIASGGVHGSGRYTTVNGGTSVTIDGKVTGSVYGGGYGGSDIVIGGTSITIDGEVIGSVYGGGHKDGATVTGDISVTIGGKAKIGETTGEGVIINSSTGRPDNGVGSFSIATDNHLSDDAEVYVVLPAGYAAGGTIATGAVREDTGRIKLTGDGAADKVVYFENGEIKAGTPPASLPPVVDEKNIFANGCELKLEEGTGGVGTVYTVVKYRPMGSEDENDYQILAVDGATGSNNATGYDLTAYTIYGGKNSKNLIDSTSIIMTGGQVDTIYGGSHSGNVNLTGNTKVTMTGGQVNYIYGGGNNAKLTGNAKISVMESAKVAGSIYGGGSDGGTVSGNAVITVGGAVEIGGAGKGVVMNGGTGTPVTNGVDSFVISGGLTGADGSVCVILPEGIEDGKVIATKAVTGDIGKIKLDGPGAVGNTAEFNSSDNTIIVKSSTTLTDAQKIALAKSSIETALNNLTVTNATTAQDIFNAAKAATLHGVAVGWDSTNGFGKTEATKAAVGVITGTLKLSLNSESGTIAINKSIAKLTGDDSSDSGSSNGGSSGGGSSSSGSSSETRPGVSIESEIKINGTVDGAGSFKAELSQKAVEDAIKKAEEEIRKKGSLNNGITLVLNINTDGGSAGSVNVNLPKVTQETIISNKVVNTVLVVDNPSIRIDINLAAVTEIHRQAQADVNITATRQDNSRLAGAVKTAIGNRPVFDLKADYGSGKQVTEFGTGSVSVAIPYTLQSGETSGGVCAVYVDGNGNVNYLTNSAYDSVNKTLRFTTSHFSTYGVGYKAMAGFGDTSGHWAEEDIQFVVNRGLLDGTGRTTFSPDTAITRGMIVTALGRLAGVDVSGYKTSSFTDVKADASYMGYVEWASQTGILSGTGTDTYAPDSAISREQMAVTLANYVRVTGCSLPNVHTETTFADTTNISSWAKDSVKTMQMAGIIASKDANKFGPQSAATRAEASATLRRFIERMMDTSTAQGWMQNDIGQWMYYVNGSPIKGQTREIDGVPYTFDNHGVTPDYSKKKSRLTHTVKAGDNLWKIAREYNVDIQTLAQINGKSVTSTIHPGEVLKIPQ